MSAPISVPPDWLPSKLDQHFLGAGLLKTVMNTLIYEQTVHQLELAE
jgi:hypothetical protein